jgi:hypothetical protein
MTGPDAARTDRSTTLCSPERYPASSIATQGSLFCSRVRNTGSTVQLGWHFDQKLCFDQKRPQLGARPNTDGLSACRHSKPRLRSTSVTILLICEAVPAGPPYRIDVSEVSSVHPQNYVSSSTASGLRQKNATDTERRHQKYVQTKNGCESPLQSRLLQTNRSTAMATLARFQWTPDWRGKDRCGSLSDFGCWEPAVQRRVSGRPTILARTESGYSPVPP